MNTNARMRSFHWQFSPTHTRLEQKNRQPAADHVPSAFRMLSRSILKMYITFSNSVVATFFPSFHAHTHAHAYIFALLRSCNENNCEQVSDSRWRREKRLWEEFQSDGMKKSQQELIPIYFRCRRSRKLTISQMHNDPDKKLHVGTGKCGMGLKIPSFCCCYVARMTLKGQNGGIFFFVLCT